jgi:DNA-binding FadR family transcriptional regulator
VGLPAEQACRPGLPEAIEARELVEPAIARLAAQRRTEADLRRMRVAVAGMREWTCDAVRFAEFDEALHAALCAAARNAILAGTLVALGEPIREMIQLFVRIAAARGELGELAESHARLVETLERGDGEAAAGVVVEMLALLRRVADLPPGAVAAGR